MTGLLAEPKPFLPLVSSARPPLMASEVGDGVLPLFFLSSPLLSLLRHRGLSAPLKASAPSQLHAPRARAQRIGRRHCVEYGRAPEVARPRMRGGGRPGGKQKEREEERGRGKQRWPADADAALSLSRSLTLTTEATRSSDTHPPTQTTGL